MIAIIAIAHPTTNDGSTKAIRRAPGYNLNFLKASIPITFENAAIAIELIRWIANSPVSNLVIQNRICIIAVNNNTKGIWNRYFSRKRLLAIEFWSA